MNILYRLTQNTFRECVREPVFYLLQLVGLVLIGILPMFSMFVFREQIKLVVDSAMATTMVLGLIAAALCSSHTITREMRNGTVLLLLSKPVPRYTFIVAKLIGVTMALTVFTFSFLAAAFVAIMIARDQFPGLYPHGHFAEYFVKTHGSSQNDGKSVCPLHGFRKDPAPFRVHKRFLFH